MISKEISKKLLEIKAVSIKGQDDLFTWVSGIKSPIYCDNRMTISFPMVRNMIADEFAKRIKREFPEVDIIAGTATAGIPHAAWVAQKLNKPMIYVRSSSKGHGKKNQIEGKLAKGQTVILIEDLFSTGGSAMKAVEAIRENGGTVQKVYAIFSYNFDKVTERFNEGNVEFDALSNYDILLPLAVDAGYIDDHQYKLLRKWNKNPRMFTEQ